MCDLQGAKWGNLAMEQGLRSWRVMYSLRRLIRHVLAEQRHKTICEAKGGEVP